MTSGLQCGLLELSAADASVATERYAERKRSYLNTAQLCADAALAFVPFIVEADGGLGKEARSVLANLAGATARLTGDAISLRVEWVMQSLAVRLQRANALAIARRAPGSAPSLAAPLAAAQAQLRFAAALQSPTPAPPGTIPFAQPLSAAPATLTPPSLHTAVPLPAAGAAGAAAGSAGGGGLQSV